MDTRSKSPPAAPAANAPAKAGRRTLLVVDDEEGPRQSLRAVFRDDYDVLLAHNGAMAIELAKRQGADVAVLDIRMADLQGTEVLQQLKRIDPDIQVIMLTAYATVETARQALQLGACDYLTKPFDLGTIRQAVSAAVERRSLSEQIRLNNERLRSLQDQIQDQMMREEIARTKGDIYASIIHDINGPLSVISGFIEMINSRIAAADRLEGRALTETKEHLAHITCQITKCLEISQRYLSFLHRRSQNEAVVSVNQILADIHQLLRVHPSAQGHQLVIHPLAENARARINGTDLSQILLNLAINAFQCSPAPHRVEITPRCRTVPLDPDQFANGPAERFIVSEEFDGRAPLLELTVSDDGPGIPPEVMPKLFEVYFTTKPPGQGTGLGLAIVQRFIREAKGALHIHTEPGRGSRFTVFLLARSGPASA